MSRLSAIPPELNGASFSVKEARDFGVPASRLRHNELSAPFRGVRTTGSVASIVDRAHAFAPLLDQQQFFSHSTAAALWGMWLPLRLQTAEIHVASIYPHREPRMVGVVGHRFGVGRVERALLFGLPLTTPVETWRLLAGELSLDELIAAGDSLVRRQNPLATIDDLVRATGSHNGVRGLALLRQALSMVRAGADSARETDLRLLIANFGLPEPTVNERVSADGEPVRFGDLVFRQWRTIAEYDGRQHRDNPRQFARDVVRLEQLAPEWTVIRVLNEHMSDPGSVAKRIAVALSRNGWRPPRSKLHLLR
ncbi:hypothetical protein [Salinibacterium sp.]|uniref:hypothetical protein n=1 Tax=Salinibacterium sp. TaxID=1915057 RepID=UPI00286CE2F7|nr:hypothetical protein [Salinibacterium sp.]